MPDNPAPLDDDNPYKAEAGEPRRAPQLRRSSNRQLWLLLAGMAWFVVPMLLGLIMAVLDAIRQAGD